MMRIILLIRGWYSPRQQRFAFQTGTAALLIVMRIIDFVKFATPQELGRRGRNMR